MKILFLNPPDLNKVNEYVLEEHSKDYIGSEDFGVFCAPSAIAEHVEAQYDVHCIGNAPSLNERYYAITGKSRADYTISKAIVEKARQILNV